MPGDTTGMSFLALELVGKRLEVMKEIAPSVRAVAILANPQHPGEGAELRASLDAAEHMGVQTSYVQVLPGGDPLARSTGSVGSASRASSSFRDAAWSLGARGLRSSR